MAGANVNLQSLGGQNTAREAADTATRTREAVKAAAPATRPNPTLARTELPKEARTADEFTPEQLREIADAFGEAVGLINKGVRVQVDETSHQVITQIIDRDTEEVIRQIPPEELLDVSRRLRAFVGTLLDLEI